MSQGRKSTQQYAFRVVDKVCLFYSRSFAQTECSSFTVHVGTHDKLRSHRRHIRMPNMSKVTGRILLPTGSWESPALLWALWAFYSTWWIITGVKYLNISCHLVAVLLDPAVGCRWWLILPAQLSQWMVGCTSCSIPSYNIDLPCYSALPVLTDAKALQAYSVLRGCK